MYCSKCGNKIRDGAQFCRSCGAPVRNYGAQVEQEKMRAMDENSAKASSETKAEQGMTGADFPTETIDEKTDGTAGNKKPRNRRWIIIIVVVATVVALLVVFIVARDRDVNTDYQEEQVIEMEEDEEPIEEVIDPEEELAEAVKEMSTEQLQQAAKDLYNDLAACSVSDPEEFAEYYLNATEEDVQSDLEYFSELELDETEKQIATVIIDSAPSVAVQIDSYETEDEFFDLSDDFIMTYTESGWKKDLSQDVSDQIYSYGNIKEVYPEAYLQALVSGRNAYQFDSCFLYLDDTAVYEGDFISEAAFISQDEYDCLTVYVWMGNGTEEDVNVNEISLMVSDAELGTVLDQTVSHEDTLEAGYSKLVQLHFDEPSEILTGTKIWTDLEASVAADYKDEDVSQAEQESSENTSNNSTDITTELKDEEVSQTEQESSQNTSNKSADITTALPDLHAETEYDIDAYCAALREENQDLNLSTSILFEDANMVFIGLDYYDKDNGNERRGCVAVPKTSAGSDITIEDYLCSKCSGNGVIVEQGTDTQTCPICGGIGQQYVPNAYYDAIMGWMGQYMVCSGCGGSGYINYTTEYYTWCDKCGGYGVTK